LAEKVGNILWRQIRAVSCKEKDRPDADQREQDRVRLNIKAQHLKQLGLEVGFILYGLVGNTHGITSFGFYGFLFRMMTCL
jgi:hypothetical protein